MVDAGQRAPGARPTRRRPACWPSSWPTGAQVLAFTRSPPGRRARGAAGPLAPRDPRPELASRWRPTGAGSWPRSGGRSSRRWPRASCAAWPPRRPSSSGIDLGGLDAVVIDGFPGTISSMWQQAGRAGRRADERVARAVVVAGDDQLDAWFCRHPDQLVARPPEPAVVNPGNPFVVRPQMACAAYEQPLVPDDASLVRRRRRRRRVRPRRASTCCAPRRPAVLGRARAAVPVGEPARELGGRGAAARRRRPPGGHARRGPPVAGGPPRRDLPAPGPAVPGRARSTPTRAWCASTTTTRRSTPRPAPTPRSTWATPERVAQVGGHRRAPRARGGAQPGRELPAPRDGQRRGARGRGARRARAAPRDPGVLVHRGAVVPAAPDRWATGDRRRRRDRRSPARSWARCTRPSTRSSACCRSSPICDRWDVGGVSMADHPATGAADDRRVRRLPGRRGHRRPRRSTWPSATCGRPASSSTRAACETGCPSCVQSPKCGNGNESLDKAAALALLEQADEPF